MMIEVDGACGEGGGQITRTAVGLSAYTGNPIRLFNIRANRPKPGLSFQHLEGIRAVASMCSAELKGDSMGSEEIEFSPGKISNNRVDVRIGTAGSTGLIFQSLQLPACHSNGDVSIEINGGATFGKYAPPLLYIKHVLLPTLSRMGFHADIAIEKHGFYPVGGARVSIKVRKSNGFNPILLDKPGKVTSIKGISVATKELEKPRVAERQESSFRKNLAPLGLKIGMDSHYVEADCPGSGMVAWAETDTGCILGTDGLGERGKPAETVGKEAADKLMKTIQSGATVDERLADQLLLFMALAKGESRIISPRFTCHCNSNIFVIQKFLPVKSRTEKSGDNALITISP
jgi:RNA 3'-phosphate cyclase